MNQSYPRRTSYHDRLSAKIDLANSLCKKTAPLFKFYTDYANNALIFNYSENESDVLDVLTTYNLLYGNNAKSITFELLMTMNREKIKDFILEESMHLLFSCNDSSRA